MAEYKDCEKAYELARTSELYSDFRRSMADLTSLKELLEDTPTADVVEVVRCEKCEHKVLMENGRVMCNRNAIKSKTNNDWYGLTATANNDFCSYGKRKGGKP